MVRRIFVVSLMAASLLLFSAYLQGGDAKAEEPASPKIVQTISFAGGSCELYALEAKSRFAPANIKDDEKAFMARLKCSLTGKSTSDDLDVLYKKGEFIAPDGRHYKAGAAMVLDESGGVIYSLLVAVPKDVEVEKLQFVYDGQALPLGK